jgi:hypothetical protein
MANGIIAQNAILTSTLSTTLLTVPGTQSYRLAKIVVSTGTTPTAFTLSFVNNSSGVTTNEYNAVAIAANRTLEIFDLTLEANDILRGGATPATDVHITFHGVAIDN